MNERMWGYSAQAGSWDGSFPIPEPERSPPLRAVTHLLSAFVPVLSPMHRPRRMLVNWAEYDPAGEEVAYHEHEETSVSSWAGVLAEVDRLSQRTNRKIAVAALFIYLDTLVLEESGESWLEDSATFQASIYLGGVARPDERAPDSVRIAYDTSIDVWLPMTHGPHGLRSNPDAAKNLPRLEAFLRDLAALVGGALSADESKLYGPALTDTGFQFVDDELEVSPDRK
jgi:hypothetical protein